MAGTIERFLPARPEGSRDVSMESGLDGRNNQVFLGEAGGLVDVSMESGLDGRNNLPGSVKMQTLLIVVSMESGLDGRNNGGLPAAVEPGHSGLNGVRPRWPEQWIGRTRGLFRCHRLNGVRPRWPEQSSE